MELWCPRIKRQQEEDEEAGGDGASVRHDGTMSKYTDTDTGWTGGGGRDEERGRRGEERNWEIVLPSLISGV